MAKQITIRCLSVVCLLVFLGVFLFLSRSYALPHFSSRESYQESDWQLLVNDELAKNSVSFPFSWELSDSDQCSFVTTLTYDPTQDNSPCLFLSVEQLYVEVFLGDELLYHYTARDVSKPAQSPGNVSAIVPLNTSCQGQQLRIQLYPALEGVRSYQVHSIKFGDLFTHLRYVYAQEIPRTYLSTIILFCGLVLALMSGLLIKSEVSAQLWNIGLFAILFGIYAVSQNRFYQYAISNPYFIHLLNCFVATFLPIPLLLYFRERMHRQKSRAYMAMLLLQLANIVVQAILHFSGIFDIRQMLFGTHVVHTATLLLIFSAVPSIPDRKKRHYFAVEGVFMGICALIDAVRFYRSSHLFYGRTAALQIGVLIMLLMEGFDILLSLKNAYTQNLKSVFYKELAYKDALTKLDNRMAFHEEINRLQSGESQPDRLICVSVDVNGLKTVNDQMGHQAGDTLIIDTADILRRYFSSYSRIFRVGGDEFMMLCYQVSEETLLESIQQLETGLAAHNASSPIPVQFAMGYCVYDGTDLDACIRQADFNMYQQKSQMHSGTYTPRSSFDSI